MDFTLKANVTYKFTDIQMDYLVSSTRHTPHSHTQSTPLTAVPDEKRVKVTEKSQFGFCDLNYLSHGIWKE